VPASQADSCDRPTPRDWSRGATVAILPETGFRCQIQFFHTGVVLTPHPDGPIGQRADSSFFDVVFSNDRSRSFRFALPASHRVLGAGDDYVVVAVRDTAKVLTHTTGLNRILPSGPREAGPNQFTVPVEKLVRIDLRR
jgi:hypothetical protein